MIQNLRETKVFNSDGTLTGLGIKENKARILRESQKNSRRSKSNGSKRKSYSRPTKSRGFNFYEDDLL